MDFADARELGIFNSAGVVAGESVFIFGVEVEILISFSCRHAAGNLNRRLGGLQDVSRESLSFFA